MSKLTSESVGGIPCTPPRRLACSPRVWGPRAEDSMSFSPSLNMGKPWGGFSEIVDFEKTALGFRLHECRAAPRRVLSMKNRIGSTDTEQLTVPQVRAMGYDVAARCGLRIPSFN